MKLNMYICSFTTLLRLITSSLYTFTNRVLWFRWINNGKNIMGRRCQAETTTTFHYSLVRQILINTQEGSSQERTVFKAVKIVVQAHAFPVLIRYLRLCVQLSWLERWFVVPKVVGSTPITHPNQNKDMMEAELNYLSERVESVAQNIDYLKWEITDSKTEKNRIFHINLLNQTIDKFKYLNNIINFITEKVLK